MTVVSSFECLKSARKIVLQWSSTGKGAPDNQIVVDSKQLGDTADLTVGSVVIKTNNVETVNVSSQK